MDLDLTDFDNDFDADIDAVVNADKPKKNEKTEDVVSSARNADENQDDDFARRRNWATTAIAALGFFLAFCAVYAFSCERWTTFSAAARATVVFASLFSIHFSAFIALKIRETSLAHILFFGATLIFGAGIFLLSFGADSLAFEKFDAPKAIWLGGFGAFALAETLRSRSLQYLAAFAFLCGLGVAAQDRTSFAAFAACALGEYWAWRRRRSSVAAIYFGLGLVALCVSPTVLTRFEFIAPLGVVGGFYLYWFGANFKSAIVRGAGVVVGTVALGVATFPEYWVSVLENVAFFGTLDVSPEKARVLALLGTVAFVVVVGFYLLLEGARQSVFRFIFSVLAFSGWAILQAVASSRTFGALETARLLGGVALFVFFLLFVERLARVRRAKLKKNAQAAPSSATTDAVDDDDEFDDVFDNEARSTRNAPRVLALSAEFDELFEFLVQKLRFPAIFAAILVQFGILAAVFAGWLVLIQN